MSDFGAILTAARQLPEQDRLRLIDALWDTVPDETLASIRRGVADAEAGRLRDIEEVDVSIRGQLGFPCRER